MNIAILLSGGVGTRMGTEVPKQYLEVGGRRIISYSIDIFLRRGDFGALCVVADLQWRDVIKELIKDSSLPIWFAEPGETRQFSIYNALNVCLENGVERDDVVVVHDAARPLVSDKLLDDCIAACLTHDGAMPVIPVKDTIYLSKNGFEIEGLLDRSELFAGQAPEAFKFGLYIDAHKKMTKEQIMLINGSSEIAYITGLKIKLVAGDPMNFKITTIDDLKTFTSVMNK